MKREVLCVRCDAATAKALLNEVTSASAAAGCVVDVYPGEHARRVRGRLRVNCVCDGCGFELWPPEQVVAWSIWADYGGIPYIPWESDYVEAGS